MSGRGGPQRIPRPAAAGPGGPAPWATIPPDQRTITLDDLRVAFTGRIGAPSFIEAEGSHRPSAVLAPFYEQDGEVWVVLTRRSWDLRNHTGEVSFPGGRSEAGETPRDAALREAREEIALDPATVDVLGELDHLMTVTSSSFIVPFVGLLPGPPTLHANMSEVDAVLHVPVRELLLDEVYREERWNWGDRDRQIFFFELVGDTLWGATAAMMRHILSLALGLDIGIDHA